MQWRRVEEDEYDDDDDDDDDDEEEEKEEEEEEEEEVEEEECQLPRQCDDRDTAATHAPCLYLDIVDGHALHSVHPALELHHLVHGVARDRRLRLLESTDLGLSEGHFFPLPPHRGSIFLVHFEDLTGE